MLSAEIDQHSLATRIFDMLLVRTALLLALCFASPIVYAQSCAPDAPRVDSGEGFTPFGEHEQALARAGNARHAWEWALGPDTESHHKVRGNLDWVSGRVYHWTLVNSGTGREVLTIRDRGRVVLRLAYPSRMNAGNALELRVIANPSIDPHTTIAATLTKLNGHAVSGSLYRTGMRKHSEQALYYYFPEMEQGFTAEGTVSLTYRRKRPTGSRVEFTVRAGTIPCAPPANRPPTVSISAPAANSAFSAPANITVSANAEDPDGTVTKVSFYANGDLIGTAASSPFGVQWANVPTGAYSLTAIAADNNDSRATSAAVPITVDARQLLYFIHVDHLNTPRLISDATHKTVWRWSLLEAFGVDIADESPAGSSASFSFPERFPGQYFDVETSLHYNHFRSFDPNLGRYARSDLIGIAGGLNTYGYVDGSPIAQSDDLGLWSTKVHNLIIETAFSNLPTDLLEAIKSGSRYADNYQLPRFSYIHAMRSSPEQSEAECRKKLCGWYEKYYEQFDRHKNSSDPIKRRFAYWSLGMALHPAMDSTSPMHDNCRIVWDFADAGFHGEDPSLEGLSALTPDLLRRTVELTRRASRSEYCRTCY